MGILACSYMLASCRVDRMTRMTRAYGGDRLKISRVRPYFAFMYASLMRCGIFLLLIDALRQTAEPRRARFARAHETRGLIPDSGLLAPSGFPCWSF